MGKRAGLWFARLLKITAIAIGGPLALLAGMALVGGVVESSLARLAIALCAIIVIPALFADRLLPDDPARGRGIVSDVLAISWLGFAFAVFGVGIGIGRTQDLVDQEARRLDSASFHRVATVTRWLGGGSSLEAAVADARERGRQDATPAIAATVPSHPADDDASEAAAPPAPEIAKPDDKPLTPEELFRRWAPSVVTIRVGEGPGGGGGTGFIIGSDGTIVTNEHVVKDSTAVAIKLKDGSWADKVELLFKDEDRDIAILRISPVEGITPTALGDSDDVKVGERVISIGNPLGLEHTLTDGLVSQRRKLRGKKMIQSTAPISPGNSGGPLFNLRGEVIGVTTASMHGYGSAQNLNLAVPINEVRDLLKEDYPDAKAIGGGGPEMGTW